MPTTAKNFFSFPNPVNERSARFVAGGVLIMSICIAVFSWTWLLIPLVYGFWARVLTGPTMSPLGQVVTRVIVPHGPWKARLVPGPPKRFAQGMGAVISSVALVLWLAGDTGAARVVACLIVVASFMESVLGFCIGCTIFGFLMKVGVIPESVCEACVVPQSGSPR